MLEAALIDNDLHRYLDNLCSYCNSNNDLKLYLFKIHSGVRLRSVCSLCYTGWQSFIIEQLLNKDIFTLQILCNSQT